VRPLPEAAAQEVAARVERRRQVVAMRTAEQNRLGTTRRASVRARIQAHLAWLAADLAEVDEDLRRQLRATPLWHEQDDLLQSVPGIGPILSRTGAARAWAALPEPDRWGGAAQPR
jgi:transposase